jgi:plasmid stabilization system protein ParE
MSRYVFHPEAFADLAEIWEFIADDNIDAADQGVADIFDTVRSLLTFPDLGRFRPELAARPLRFVLVRSYVVGMTQRRSRFGSSQYCTRAGIHGSLQPLFEAEGNTFQEDPSSCPRDVCNNPIRSCCVKHAIPPTRPLPADQDPHHHNMQ